MGAEWEPTAQPDERSEPLLALWCSIPWARSLVMMVLSMATQRWEAVARDQMLLWVPDLLLSGWGRGGGKVATCRVEGSAAWDPLQSLWSEGDRTAPGCDVHPVMLC